MHQAKPSYMPPVRLMLDLETLSTSSDAKILSIGIYQFDTKSNNRFTFYEKCDPLEADTGHQDTETIQWWKAQPKDISEETFSGKKSLKEVIYLLDSYVRGIHGCDLENNLELWCKGK